MSEVAREIVATITDPRAMVGPEVCTMHRPILPAIDSAVIDHHYLYIHCSCKKVGNFLCIQWNLVNMIAVRAKHLLNTNHFEIPGHYNS